MSKKYKNGLILGRFEPLHLGHMYLITTGANGCENLVVLACGVKRDIIPADLRYKWVKDYCSNHQNINVVDMQEELPQLPEEHTEFWEIWCDVIKRSCPDIEVIYSSEDYGFELAKRLGIVHELVDKERKQYPISGTAVRNNFYENWDKFFAGARPYFINRFYFLGPESTGKTTISKKFSETLETNWVPEYGRILYEEKNGKLDFFDFAEIVIKQREIENNLAKKTEKTLMFCDTETITTKVFCDMYYPEDSHKLNEFFDYHIKKQLINNCHFFVMNPEQTEAVQDGTRNHISSDQRSIHFKKIVQELDKWKLSYTILNGDYENRFLTVQKYIENIKNYNNQNVNSLSFTS